MTDPAVSSVRDNNTVPELPKNLGVALGRAIGGAGRFLVFGHHPGRATLSRPSEPAHQAWLAPLGALTALFGSGALAYGLHDEGSLMVGLGGAAIAVSSALLPVVALGAVALERTVPPPRRPDCLAVPAAEHPLHPMNTATDLVAMGPGLYVAQRPLTFHGMAVGTRMTVVVMCDGRVLVHSPVALDDTLERAVRKLGPVTWIVAPNALHHLFVQGWHEAFPEAALIAAEGLPERRPDLPFTHVLTGASPEVPWDREELNVTVVGGHPLLTELVLLHTPSHTLIVSDLIQNLGHAPETPRLARWLLRLAATAERPAPPVDLRLSLTDPAAMRAGAERVGAWDFNRIVLAHGRLVEVDARAVWRDAFAFLAEAPAT